MEDVKLTEKSPAGEVDERMEWVAPTARVHAIGITQNATANFAHGADGGSSPCRS